MHERLHWLLVTISLCVVGLTTGTHRGIPSTILWCVASMLSRQDADARVDPTLMVALVASVVIQWYTIVRNPALWCNALAAWTQGGVWMWACWLWGRRGCTDATVYDAWTRAFVALAVALDLIGTFSCFFAGVALALTAAQPSPTSVVVLHAAALLEVVALRLPRSDTWITIVVWSTAAALIVASGLHRRNALTRLTDCDAIKSTTDSLTSASFTSTSH